jgi:hypothetical protein
MFVGATDAQVVQLPVLRTFSTNGSVSVPDQGSANLGGVDRYHAHRSSNGIPLTGGFQDRTFSTATSRSHISVKATIIDLDELDRRVLAAATPDAEKPRSELDRRAAYITRNIGRFQPTAQLAPLVNHSRSSKANQKEFKRFLDRGDAAYDQGKYRLARNYYRNAMNMASEADKQLVIDRMKKLR